MWFAPSSVVHYQLRGPIAAEDIRLFRWRWNMRSVLSGYRYFERKWGLDITERGRFRAFLARLLGAALKPLRVPRWLLSNLQAWWIGYFDWPPSSPD